MSTDRIEKQVLLRAPRSRVWRALTDAKEFGTWFGVNLRGGFAAGARVQGQITHPGYTHVTLDVTVVRMEPEGYFSWRWHPNAVEPGFDYSEEPTTLVEFHLEEVEGGTRLTVVESGFDAIPLPRRAEAFEANDGGWAAQLENVRRHVSA
jgi:uncharacterized protein YndB with AHSA1/START domain